MIAAPHPAWKAPAVVRQGAASVILCLLATAIAPARAAPPPRPCTLVDEVSFDPIGGQIVVAADLGGKAPHRLLLDTGSYENYLWSAEAAALGWKPSDEVERRDASTSFTVRQISGRRVAVGKAVVTGQSFAVRPRTIPHVDGLLGYPFISRFVVGVDPIAHRLRFWSPGCDRVPSGATALPLRFFAGRMPAVEASLVMADGVAIATTLMVDTGAGTSLILNTPFVARHRLLARAGTVVDEETGSIGGGHSSLASARARELRLGPFVLARPIVSLGKPTASFGADHPWDGIVGGGVLSRFQVTFDYPRRRLLLVPNACFAAPFRQDALAMLLVDAPEGARVAALRPRGQADRAGLRSGDVIVAITGRSASPPGTKLTARALYDALEKDGVYHLEVRRVGRPISLTLTVKNVL
ncbi:MAG TPA: aspartyl protease family protein [Thermoanaerobaculia bacterium]|nr:aspartyl protease family protein [Thermoanaerobaculia bacterium]